MTSEVDEEREADRREASDGRTARTAATSRERSEEETSGTSSGADGSDTPRDSEVEVAADEDEDGPIPIEIAGHDDGEPPSEATAAENGEANPYPSGVQAPDAAGNEVEPVEVLVGLAEDGEIDPWDIDVVRVTDKFLEAMDEADLRTSGRALFYASVLIRMKGDAMLASDEEPEPEEPWEAAPAADAPIDGADPFATLESEMDRRLERRRARGMPETLDELVRDLRDAERDSWWKRSRTYDTSESPEGFRRGTQELDYRAADDLRMDDEPTEHDVTGATHGEDVDRIIEDVYDTLGEQYEQGREEVLYREIARAGGSRVETYLGLLFLAHRGRVRLSQDELFGDLWIQNAGASSGGEEAVAD
jgi:segregation and condensation protein A